MVICPECEGTNNEPDTIEGLPTPENAQVWFCKHCLTTFYTTKADMSSEISESDDEYFNIPF